MSKQNRNRRCWRSAGVCRTTCARLVALPFAIGCIGDTRSSEPVVQQTGTVRVRVTTVGPDQDANGYTIVMDGRRIGNITVSTPELPIPTAFGRHTVAIADIASNCTADVNMVTVTISATDPSPVANLSVTCVALGVVQFTAVTTGVDLDRDGYFAWVRGSDPGAGGNARVPANGSRETAGLPAGTYFVYVQDLAANCDVAEPFFPTSVAVSSGRTTTVPLAISCAPAGRLAFTSASETGDRDLFSVTSSGTGTTRLTTGGGKEDDAAWSPDGREIAFSSDADGVRAIYVMNEDGTGVTRLTMSPLPDYQPAWSPDGRRIAFTSERDSNAEIYVMNRDGSNVVRVTNNPASDREPAWSPDGSRIAFSSTRAGQHEIYVMNVDGSSVTRLTLNHTWDGQPAWSPDGKSLAFARTRCDAPSPANCYPVVIVMTGSVEVREVGIGEHPAWSPDGSRLAATRFQCPYSFYYPLSDCVRAGIGIYGIAPPPAPLMDLWTPVLTEGSHFNPTWRP